MEFGFGISVMDVLRKSARPRKNPTSNKMETVPRKGGLNRMRGFRTYPRYESAGDAIQMWRPFLSFPSLPCPFSILSLHGEFTWEAASRRRLATNFPGSTSASRLSEKLPGSRIFPMKVWPIRSNLAILGLPP